MLKAFITSVNVCVRLTVPQFFSLDSLDPDCVEKRLKRLGAENIEYNSHFGSAIYFTCTKRRVNRIRKAIEKLVAKA